MKIKMHLPVLLVCATLFALPAISFQYDEATQGDIANLGGHGALPLFILDMGQNVIRGSTRLGGQSDVDAFRFKVPPGAVLDLNSIVYEYQITDISGEINAFGSELTVGGIVPGSPTYATGFFIGDGNFGDDTFYLYNDGSIQGITVRPSPITLPFFQIIDSSVNLDFPAPPLTAGIYYLNPGFHWFGGFGPNDSASWNYTITLTVTPAP
jgi:hypothetical protein